MMFRDSEDSDIEDIRAGAEMLVSFIVVAFISGFITLLTAWIYDSWVIMLCAPLVACASVVLVAYGLRAYWKRPKYMRFDSKNFAVTGKNL